MELAGIGQFSFVMVVAAGGFFVFFQLIESINVASLSPWVFRIGLPGMKFRCELTAPVAPKKARYRLHTHNTTLMFVNRKTCVFTRGGIAPQQRHLAIMYSLKGMVVFSGNKAKVVGRIPLGVTGLLVSIAAAAAILQSFEALLVLGMSLFYFGLAWTNARTHFRSQFLEIVGYLTETG